jgi:hypothetical protein
MELTASDNEVPWVITHSPQDRSTVSFGTFLTVYLSSLMMGVLLSVLVERLTGVDGLRVGGAYCGTAFFAGFLRKPRLWFMVLRSTGWFALIESELVIRLIMLVGSVVCFGLAVQGSPVQSP